MAETDIGTSWRFSDCFCAVTTISLMPWSCSWATAESGWPAMPSAIARLRQLDDNLRWCGVIGPLPVTAYRRRPALGGEVVLASHRHYCRFYPTAARLRELRFVLGDRKSTRLN